MAKSNPKYGRMPRNWRLFSPKELVEWGYGKGIEKGRRMEQRKFKLQTRNEPE